MKTRRFAIGRFPPSSSVNVVLFRCGLPTSSRPSGRFFPDGHEPVFRMIELVARTLEAAAQEGCTHVGVGSMLEQGRRAGIEEAARVAETMPKLWAGFSDHKSHSERGPCWCLAIASQIRLLAGKGEREK